MLCIRGVDRSDRLLLFAADEREHGALGVLGIDDPASAGDLHWTVEDAAAAGFHAFGSGADGIDAEVEVPAGDGNVPGPRHHAAITHRLVVAFVEEAIDAHRAHVHVA